MFDLWMPWFVHRLAVHCASAGHEDADEDQVEEEHDGKGARVMGAAMMLFFNTSLVLQVFLSGIRS